MLSEWKRRHIFFILWLTFSNDAVAQYPGSCAEEINNIAYCTAWYNNLSTECVNAFTALTTWPGLCECSYYAYFLNCYDGWAPCATDAWTSVDQQFRDGVTSCVEQDSQYTIQAQLGPVANPFSASLTRAERTTTDAASSAAATIWKTYFDIPTLRSDTAAYASTPSSYTQEPTLAPHKNAEAASKSGTPVGTIVGMIIFGCVVVMVWILCFKFAKKKTKPMKEQMVREEYHKPELGASEGRPQIVSPVPEIGADERSLQELNPAVEYSEMVGSTLVHELDV